MARHRFRPRFRGVALTAVGVGGGLAGVTLVAAGFVVLPVVTGLVGVGLGAVYLASPVWRLSVTTDERGMSVGSDAQQRFSLAWDEVVRVIASPSTTTCFVDGGTPEKSLLVPGPGAIAPYDIDDKKALYDEILAHVAGDKVTIVEALDQAPR